MIVGAESSGHNRTTGQPHCTYLEIRPTYLTNREGATTEERVRVRREGDVGVYVRYYVNS